MAGKKQQVGVKTIRWLLALRIVLGVIFILAAVSKLGAHAQFVSEVSGYGLLPAGLATVYATALPWVELAAGCALVAGLFTTPALVLSLLMTLSYLIGNSYVLAIGNAGTCNCFGQLIPLNHTASLVIDCIMLAATGVLFRYRDRNPSRHLDFLASRLSWRGRSLAALFPPTAFHGLLLAVVVLVVGLPASFIDTGSAAYREMNAALEAGRPVVLSFYLDGCAECAEQKPVLNDLEDSYGSYVSFIRADFNGETKLADDYGVYRVPTTVVMEGTGNHQRVLATFNGLATREDLLHVFYDTIRAPFWNEFGPLADFEASPVTGEVPLLVQFRDDSLGVVENWGWDFDSDGTTDDTVQNPFHVFTQPGSYTITLSINGTFGADAVTKTGILNLTSNRIEAGFSASPREFTDLTTPVKFFDSSIGVITDWNWDFNGDGVIDSTERDPSHVYDAPGRYSVSLTVSGPAGSDTAREENYIYVVNTVCKADFTASITEVTGKNEPVYFYDKSEGDIIAWEWDFDSDGTIDSTGQNPVYVFTKDGTYSVTLTVRTAVDEDTLTLSDYITVKGCST